MSSEIEIENAGLAFAKDFCERHPELEFDDVRKGIAEAYTLGHAHACEAFLVAVGKFCEGESRSWALLVKTIEDELGIVAKQYEEK